MITFLKILISYSVIPKSDLVFSHNSSCDVPISTSSVPKSHIDMSHISSCYDQNINFSCPKKTSCPIIYLKETQNRLLLSQKIILFSPKFRLVMTISQLLLSQKVTFSVPYVILLWRNIGFSCPKSHLVLSHDLSFYDSISYSSVSKSHPVSPMIRHIMT